jgi:hypothetical protein
MVGAMGVIGQRGWSGGGWIGRRSDRDTFGELDAGDDHRQAWRHSQIFPTANRRAVASASYGGTCSTRTGQINVIKPPHPTAAIRASVAQCGEPL